MRSVVASRFDVDSASTTTLKGWRLGAFRVFGARQASRPSNTRRESANRPRNIDSGTRSALGHEWHRGERRMVGARTRKSVTGALPVVSPLWKHSAVDALLDTKAYAEATTSLCSTSITSTEVAGRRCDSASAIRLRRLLTKTCGSTVRTMSEKSTSSCAATAIASRRVVC